MHHELVAPPSIRARQADRRTLRVAEHARKAETFLGVLQIDDEPAFAIRGAGHLRANLLAQAGAAAIGCGEILRADTAHLAVLTLDLDSDALVVLFHVFAARLEEDLHVGKAREAIAQSSFQLRLRERVAARPAIFARGRLHLRKHTLLPVMYW